MDIATRINELLAKGRVLCLATVVASDFPQIAAGQKTIILADGAIKGGFGHEPLDLAALKQGLKAFEGNKRGTVEIQPGLRVFFDVITAESTLVVCGAGYIAIPLVRFARAVGFNVTVLDDRSDFAHPSRFPASTVIAENFSSALRDLPLGPSAYVVIITCGHEHDVDCLMEILPRKRPM